VADLQYRILHHWLLLVFAAPCRAPQKFWLYLWESGAFLLVTDLVSASPSNFGPHIVDSK
jgi:hypothetical protein